MKLQSKCREGCKLLPGTDGFEIGLPNCPLFSPQNHSEKRVTIAPQEVKVKSNYFLPFLAFYNFSKP